MEFKKSDFCPNLEGKPTASARVGTALHSIEVESADKFDGAFKEAIKARSAALVVSGSSLFNSFLKQIADLAIKNRLPTIGSREDFVDNGGLMSYGTDPG